MSEQNIKRALGLAHAAMTQVTAVASEYRAAVMREAGIDELETLRRRAHDLLDAALDHEASAASAYLRALYRD